LKWLLKKIGFNLKTANEFYGKEKRIKEMCFFDAECDDITDAN
jgi:hypothetical protein